MSGTTILRSAAIVTLLVFVVYWVCGLNMDNSPASPEQNVTHDNSTGMMRQSQVAPSIITQHQNATSFESESLPSGDHQISYIPYDKAWCISSIDLNESDYALAQQERIEWAEQRGEIWTNRYGVDGDYSEFENAAYLEPYKEMDKGSLLELAWNDDKYALLTTLQRQNIDWDTQDKTAYRLLELGATSMSLMHFITKEMVRAHSAYEKHGRVTPNIKKHVINALSYLSYGLRRYDSSVLFHYVTLVDGDPIYQEALRPELVLKPEEITQVGSNAEILSNQIDAKRREQNLDSFGYQELPIIASHEFEERLAFLYAKYARSMETIQRLELSTSPSLEKSQCVKRYMNLLATGDG